MAQLETPGCPRCGTALRQTRELDGYEWWCINHGEVSLRHLETVERTFPRPLMKVPKRKDEAAG